jgi:AcrR family transcriptional regulator
MPRTKIQTEQVRTESRAKIITTARRLFAEKGFDGCNVSDIAKQAGMSQGNIYWHFASKDELFQAVLVEGFQAIGATMSEAATGQGSGLEKFDRFLERFLAFCRDQGGEEFVTINITSIAQGGVRRFAQFGVSTEQLGMDYHRALNAIFAQGQVEGTFRADLDPNLLTTFLFSFTNGMMLMYPLQWRDISAAEVRAALLRLLGNQ